MQQAIATQLKQYGFEAKTEVKFNGGYADIVTNWRGNNIIEVKKYLTRKTIYEAFGQLNLYGLKNEYKFIITGFYPTDADEKQAAITTASMVEQTERVRVLFID